MDADIPSTRLLMAVRDRPRFRASKLRELILEMARRSEGTTLEDARSEFWVVYDLEPTRNLMNQQAALLVRDKRIERVGWGAYKAVRYEMPNLTSAARSPSLG